jgi:hypothetical protein
MPYPSVRPIPHDYELANSNGHMQASGHVGD